MYGIALITDVPELVLVTFHSTHIFWKNWKLEILDGTKFRIYIFIKLEFRKS